MARCWNRRQALAAVGLAGVGGVPSAAADDKKAGDAPFRMDKPVITATHSLDPRAGQGIVSGDGLAMSLIFGDVKLGDLQIGIGPAEKYLSATKLVTFKAAVHAPADGSLIGYRQTLRGFVQKGKNSRVVIIADLVGTTKVVEYPYGQDMAAGENIVITFFSPDVNQTNGNEVVAPLPEYAGTITLLVQTRSPQDGVLAAIDSLDVETAPDHAARAALQGYAGQSAAEGEVTGPGRDHGPARASRRPVRDPPAGRPSLPPLPSRFPSLHWWA